MICIWGILQNRCMSSLEVYDVIEHDHRLYPKAASLLSLLTVEATTLYPKTDSCRDAPSNIELLTYLD